MTTMVFLPIRMLEDHILFIHLIQIYFYRMNHLVNSKIHGTLFHPLNNSAICSREALHWKFPKQVILSSIQYNGKEDDEYCSIKQGQILESTSIDVTTEVNEIASNQPVNANKFNIVANQCKDIDIQDLEINIDFLVVNKIMWRLAHHITMVISYHRAQYNSACVNRRLPMYRARQQIFK